MMHTTTLSQSQEASFVAPARILVATDLTDGDHLVPHAVAQAKTTGARVTLVHAVAPAEALPMEGGYVVRLDPTILDEAARLQLEKLARRIELEGVSCDISVEFGFAADVIREEAKSVHATRLIMGSHGRGKWGKLILGSVAEKLLGSISIPIFVVGPHALPTDHAVPQRILHPVSLIGDYRKSLDLALGLADSYKAELTLLHVLDRNVENNNPARTLTWAENRLMSLIPATDVRGNIHAQAVCGRLVEETLIAAEKTNADWIVLGVDGNAHLPFKNSKAYEVIASANCCVLTLRHDPHPVEAINTSPAQFDRVFV